MSSIPPPLEMYEFKQPINRQQPQQSHRFFNGSVVSKTVVRKSTYAGPIALYKMDNGVKNISFGTFGALRGLYTVHYSFQDIQTDMSIIAHNKLGICFNHCIMCFKPDKLKKTLHIPVCKDSLELFKQLLKTKKGECGIGVVSLAPCDAAFKDQCKIKNFLKVKAEDNKNNKVGKVEKKKVPAHQTYLAVKRKAFALRAGLNEDDSAAITDDGELINMTIKNVIKRYPVLEQYPGLAMEYALGIYDQSYSLQTIPRCIKQKIKSNVATKRKMNNILGGLGVVNDIDSWDMDRDAHDDNPKKKIKMDEEVLYALKKEWQKEYEEKNKNHNQ